MRETWFCHPEPLDTKTADELISQYQLRNVKATKTLAMDPCFWLVSALLPEYRSEPKPSKQFRNPIWS